MVSSLPLSFTFFHTGCIFNFGLPMFEHGGCSKAEYHTWWSGGGKQKVSIITSLVFNNIGWLLVQTASVL
ncbi:hypothetical protein ACRRTK_007014 [Alexandromys fortis]